MKPLRTPVVALVDTDGGTAYTVPAGTDGVIVSAIWNEFLVETFFIIEWEHRPTDVEGAPFAHRRSEFVPQ